VQPVTLTLDPQSTCSTCSQEYNVYERNTAQITKIACGNIFKSTNCPSCYMKPVSFPVVDSNKVKAIAIVAGYVLVKPWISVSSTSIVAVAAGALALKELVVRTVHSLEQSQIHDIDDISQGDFI
jgi:hypothetical protein